MITGQLDPTFISYSDVRAMRKEPTVRLARALSMAPILMSEWSYETLDNVPDGALSFIRNLLDKFRLSLLRPILEGANDFGWVGFEIIWGLDEQRLLVPRWLKPLLQDYTAIIVDDAGKHIGLRQQIDNSDITLGGNEYLLFNQDVEGTDWYGCSTMESVKIPYDKKVLIENTADRFDRKISGTHWVVYYPPGQTDGRDNLDIAGDILNALQANGTIAIPTSVDQMVDLHNETGGTLAWRIELISASGGSSDFSARLKYQDTQITRAHEFPERAILEGQFGTKAEAAVHTNLALTNMDVKHQLIVDDINQQLVDTLLQLNFGAPGTVRIIPSPLTDTRQEYLRSVYTAILASDASEWANIDTDALREKVGIPTEGFDSDSTEITLDVLSKTL